MRLFQSIFVLAHPDRRNQSPKLNVQLARWKKILGGRQVSGAAVFMPLKWCLGVLKATGKDRVGFENHGSWAGPLTDHARGCALSYARFNRSVVTCVYTCVETRCACPRSSCTLRRSAPASIMCVA